MIHVDTKKVFSRKIEKNVNILLSQRATYYIIIVRDYGGVLKKAGGWCCIAGCNIGGENHTFTYGKCEFNTMLCGSSKYEV
jgi:hypothetical protein